ncbi:uncharacterized protein EAE98_011200 [Botrytis deweyae]|uniref:Uncharacterized protein n=1 Tax=Botrytis deweyae TaxID=2478750 RepID=A0ABQ7I6J2_9HELO|nr:uncharacterized protein EAE98_011200 [Botrytis deweyae]KAF7915334.1 hypothetical protein EAE98_011200 [Botrytis deweyae]
MSLSHATSWRLRPIESFITKYHPELPHLRTADSTPLKPPPPKPPPPKPPTMTFSLTLTPLLHLLPTLFGTIFILFGLNAMLRPLHALTFYPSLHHSLSPSLPQSPSNTILLESLLTIYGARDIFMGPRHARRILPSQLQNTRLDCGCGEWCCVCGWVGVLEGWRGTGRSLGVCACTCGCGGFAGVGVLRMI